jgi:hypothetical protein
MSPAQKKRDSVSARERFFKMVQQRQNPPAPGDGSVEADIQAFCLRMDELAQQIQQWFEGSGIDVAIATTRLQDLSTVGRSLNSGASRYDITTIRIQNDTRSASIVPEQLYQHDRNGCVTIIVDAPDRMSGKQRFYLSMARESGWYIRSGYQTTTNNSMMTEEAFFKAVENLA